MASSTRFFVSAATKRDPLSTCDTVAVDARAALATSRIVVILQLSKSDAAIDEESGILSNLNKTPPFDAAIPQRRDSGFDTTPSETVIDCSKRLIDHRLNTK